MLNHFRYVLEGPELTFCFSHTHNSLGALAESSLIQIDHAVTMSLSLAVANALKIELKITSKQ